MDGKFVIPMTRDRRREAIVRATIALAHDLGFEAVAEGVEDRETWHLLTALGCDVAQGFHIARPMPPSEVMAWLDAWDPTQDIVRKPEHVPARLRTYGPPSARRVLAAADGPAIVEMIPHIPAHIRFPALT